MDKYAQLKKLHHDCQLKFYVYAFMHIDTKTIQVEGYFLDTKTFFDNYKKISSPGPGPKHWIIFSYINSEDYELDVNFDETSLKKNRPHIQQ